MSLSERLNLIASLVPKGARVCDIGTDHGYLAIELVSSGKAKSVIAADIGEKPLKNAAKNITAAKVQGISLRLCDGFSGISADEFDLAVIAGMGGEVISGILERGIRHIDFSDKTLLLCPTTSPEILRKFLYQTGFSLIEEHPVFENRKLYSVIKAIRSGTPTVVKEYHYFVGKVSPKDEAGLLYIKKQQKRCFDCLTALKDNPQETERYEYYRSVYEDITQYIDSGL